ncbi:MAG: Mut7-C RNAse domain-containing protein [Nitrospirota bacterium]
MKFIADAMLGSLARRLRLLGLDVLYDPASTDNEVLRLSLEQARTILTRDTAFASRPLASNHLLIRDDNIDKQVEQVLSFFPASDSDALTRCSVCNGTLDALIRNDARDLVPDHVFATTDVFWRCGSCGRVYWKGSHVRNMGSLRTKK